MVQAGFASCDNLCTSSHVTLICSFEYENIAAHIVGDPKQIARIRIERNRAGQSSKVLGPSMIRSGATSPLASSG